MLTYVITDQKKFNIVEDIEINNCSDIWGGHFMAEVVIEIENQPAAIYPYDEYSIKHFIDKYGFIITEE